MRSCVPVATGVVTWGRSAVRLAPCGSFGGWALRTCCSPSGTPFGNSEGGRPEGRPPCPRQPVPWTLRSVLGVVSCYVTGEITGACVARFPSAVPVAISGAEKGDRFVRCDPNQVWGFVDPAVNRLRKGASPGIEHRIRGATPPSLPILARCDGATPGNRTQTRTKRE